MTMGNTIKADMLDICCTEVTAGLTFKFQLGVYTMPAVWHSSGYVKRILSLTTHTQRLCMHEFYLRMLWTAVKVTGSSMAGCGTSCQVDY